MLLPTQGKGKRLTDDKIIINPKYIVWSRRITKLLLALSLLGILCGIAIFVLAFVTNNYWLLFGYLLSAVSYGFGNLVLNAARDETIKGRRIKEALNSGNGAYRP